MLEKSIEEPIKEREKYKNEIEECKKSGTKLPMSSF